jgi:hypothetical protein
MKTLQNLIKNKFKYLFGVCLLIIALFYIINNLLKFNYSEKFIDNSADPWRAWILPTLRASSISTNPGSGDAEVFRKFQTPTKEHIIQQSYNSDSSLLTCVSGYWNVKNKYENNNESKYDKWFQNTLQINCPYVFFTNKKGIEYIKKFRKDLPTYFIECSITDFKTYKYKDKMITHPGHCPSIELNFIIIAF